MDAPNSQLAPEELFGRVHIALVPDVEGMTALVSLQACIQGSLAPEYVRRITWVPPEMFGIVLAYVGCIRSSMVEILHDIMKEIFLPETAFTLQAHRFGTVHDAQGSARVIGVGLALHEPLLALRSRLVQRLAGRGVDCLPAEFTPRITLARLPEDAGPVMSVLESLSSRFPMTLRFLHADLASRDGLKRVLLARVIPGRPAVRGVLAGLHGCCHEQSGRFALYGGMDCPMRSVPEYALNCFETGCTPAHPAEAPSDTQVEAEIIHEGMQDLLRSGRSRLSASAADPTFQESEKTDAPPDGAADRRLDSPRESENPGPAFRSEKKDVDSRRGISVNHRDPRKHESGRQDSRKKQQNEREPSNARRPEKSEPRPADDSLPSRRRDRGRRRQTGGPSSPQPPKNQGGGE